MAGRKIVVVGSSNTDMVVSSANLPRPGETVLGSDFLMNPGGKGANQAVAAARLGGNVCFVARVGNDLFGQEAVKGFEQHGIDTSMISVDDHHASGVALIMVDANGENCISVALGANGAMNREDIMRAESFIRQASYVLIQLEIPLAVVSYTIQFARSANVPVILNPAPARELPDDLLSGVYLISPNETEAEALTGITVSDVNSARSAAQALRSKGVEVVIITLGALGAYLLSSDADELLPCPKVKVVDTTAAGDTFNGALAVALSEGTNLSEAVLFANRAAAYAVTRRGAQSSTPSRNDLIDLK